ncbi:hypothetical protein U3A58_05380 [Algoriphagus sp. C2-6-M1]|uniref:hypothetical protein n=1 Tax=Algoriphagus persicinus TaxID=3108754 RepID=UPI002B39E874|nr:hypothetical protein [Algoriphagus sp. C2-6-M1]MEB2779818.1 hypothetical protein [Algoriphagus sp. C2-6-M1]
MEKIKSNFFLVFWILLALGAMITIWFLPWRFQTNDDEIMMWLVSGAYTGTPESYAVFIHPILSWFFAQLYTFFPDITWYPLSWFVVIFLSYLGLVLSLRQIKIDFSGKNILSLFCLCLFLHFGLFLQFTLVAGIAGFSALLLLYTVGGRRTGVFYLFSLVLFACSIMIRWESFILISLGLGFYFLSFKPVHETLKYSKRILIPLLVLAVLVGSKIYWENQSQYADFVRYNEARAAVSDHPVSYKLISEDKLDSDSKWFFFSQWMLEGDYLSIKELRERKSELDADLLAVDQLFHSLHRLILVTRAEAFKSIFSLILIGLYLYRFKASAKSLIFLVSWMAFFLVFNLFFILNGRVVILFFLPFLFPLVLEPVQKFEGRKSAQALATLIVLLFGYHLFNFFGEARAREIMREEFLSLTAKLPKGSLLVMEGYKENYLGINYSMNYPVPLLCLGWISQSPFQQKKLQKLDLMQVADAKEYYLLGVDANEEFFFPDYMNYLGENYYLEKKTEEANFILFHYTRNP